MATGKDQIIPTYSTLFLFSFFYRGFVAIVQTAAFLTSTKLHEINESVSR